MDITVGIADLQLSTSRADVIVTYGLGSCIAVAVYDPLHKVGGMLHYMLPASTTDPAKAAARPAMFADTGVPLLFQQMYAQGCQKKDLIVKIAGGGKLYDDHGLFEIGKRNYTIVRKMLWKVGVPIAAEDVGGEKSRTLLLQCETGKCTIRSMGTETPL